MPRFHITLMRYFYSYFILLVLLPALFQCKTLETNGLASNDHLENHKQWQSQRISGLTKPTGYLSIVGLFWLEEGENSFGSALDNEMVFPQSFPKKLGHIYKANDQLILRAITPVSFTTDSMHQTEAELRSDATPPSTMMNWESYYWYVIKRGDRYGVRLKDTLAYDRMNLTEIPNYTYDQQWLKKSTFYPATGNQTIAITNVIGITYDRKLMGHLEFEHTGKKHRLVATDGGNDQLFIVFADQTNGKESYGGGRFLYVDIPETGDQVIMNFNRAENPVCAFSDYATCPLPRPENYLPFEVTAGEKKAR